MGYSYRAALPEYWCVEIQASVAELELAIDLYVARHNIDPKPIWLPTFGGRGQLWVLSHYGRRVKLERDRQLGRGR